MPPLFKIQSLPLKIEPGSLVTGETTTTIPYLQQSIAIYSNLFIAEFFVYSCAICLYDHLLQTAEDDGIANQKGKHHSKPVSTNKTFLQNRMEKELKK